MTSTPTNRRPSLTKERRSYLVVSKMLHTRSAEVLIRTSGGMWVTMGKYLADMGNRLELGTEQTFHLGNHDDSVSSVQYATEISTFEHK